MLRENTLQCTVHAVGMHITAATYDHTEQRDPARGDQLTKAEVVDPHNTSLLPGLPHNA